MNSENNELQVTQYDCSEIENKKKRILLKIGLSVGGVTLLAILLHFGLSSDNDNGNDIVSPTERPGQSFVVGGSSAWFNSVIEFL
ncbi:MAG: hypothetical protein LBC73_06245 [Oscillospiraceae bacterium]|nr:hypothetical protein [Oscillospiraceae bacterium]